MASRPEPQDAQHPRTRKRRGSMNGCGNNRGQGQRLLVTASVSGCRRSRPSSGLAAVTCVYARWVLLGLPSVSCAYPYDPQRSRAVVGPSLGAYMAPEAVIAT